MSEALTKAKEMYWQFACSHFFMDHDGVLQDYQRYGATSEHEESWRKEYIAHWIGHLSIDDMTAVDKLHHAHAWEALPELFVLSSKGDDYAKLWYANAIWDLARALKCPREHRKRGKEIATQLWKELAIGTLSITPAHRTTIRPWMRALKASTPEEYVRHYAQMKLREK